MYLLNRHESPATPSTIKIHINNILNVFKSSPSIPKRLASRTINSLADPENIPGYLVISPRDIAIMINSLFPERPNSPSSPVGLRSGASSADSAPSTVGNSRATSEFDTASIFSYDDSSVFSDTTSLLGDDRIERSTAVAEIDQVLRAYSASGDCDPYDERWAVIFISADGQGLSTRAITDTDSDTGDDTDDKQYSSGSDVDDDKTSDPSLSYYELRDAVFKLLEDYEIPNTRQSRSSSKHARSGSAARAHSENPYLLFDSDSSSEKGPKPSDAQPWPQENSGETKNVDEELPSVLVSMLEAAERQCIAQSDFTNAHMYWTALNLLTQLSSENLRRNGFATLLNIFSRGPRDSVRRSTIAIEKRNPWLRHALKSQKRYNDAFEAIIMRQSLLRDKIWYCTDVRNSTAYEIARNHAISLKPTATSAGTSPAPAKISQPRNSSQNFTEMKLAENQNIDLFTTYKECCGPNKLSDEQSDITLKWLSKGTVENICKGEERIHRFCLVIKNCVDELVGESLLAGPVLWGSSLFQREKRRLDSDKPDVFKDLDFFERLGEPGDNMSDTDSGYYSHSIDNMMETPMAWSNPFPHPPHSLLSQPPLQHDKRMLDSLNRDRQHPLGMSGEKLGAISAAQRSLRKIDSSMLQDRGKPMPKGKPIAKQEFLSDLKKTLTSLLLSDLSPLLFGNGSETDDWVSGNLGQESLENIRLANQKIRRKATKSVIGKRKSFQDAGSAAESYKNKAPTEAHDLEYSAAGKTSTDRRNARIDSMTNAYSSGDAGRSKKYIAKKPGKQDFPWRKAFQQHLAMFSINPNPHSKLNALYNLECQIIAYLKSKGILKPQVPAPSFPRTRGTNAHGRVVTTDAILEVLTDILKDPDIRPKTLFRDLQFIAALIPAHILDKTERGKAFWDTGLAALSLKQDICRTMTETADEIVNYYTKIREEKSSVPSSIQSTAAKQMKYTLKDAAKMFIVAAKEGDCIAERELAIFYLTTPELTESVIAPLSKAGEVFRHMSQHRSNGAMGSDKSGKLSDKQCLAYHWMELAAQGGDDLAKKYLRQREGLEG